MASLKKSTIVRTKNAATKAFFRTGERVAPSYAGKVARDFWFLAPPRLKAQPLPEGGEPFTVVSEGALVVGQVWSPSVSTSSTSGGSAAGGSAAGGSTGGESAGGPGTVYLVHGWGGRGSQFAAIVEPLLDAGHRVVMFDAPAHGDSERVPTTGRQANGVQFARALDAVFTRFGPAEAVVAHSLGTIATYLELRFGWLGTKRLVFIAPMVEALSLFDAFQAFLGFGPRTRRGFDQAVLDWVGLPVDAFDARVQASYSEPLPTLVVADRNDKQTPYDDAADLARAVGAEFMTTEGLGHRRILRDPDVIDRVVAFVGGHERERAESLATA